MQDKDIIPFEMPLLNKIVRRAEEEHLPIAQNTENIEREAYEKGFEAGEKSGFAMGEQKAIVLVEKVEAIIKELTTLRETLIKELEPQFVELAVTMARKIILKELTMNPDEIVEITKEAITRMERTGQITIKINPSLYDLFMKHKPEILSLHPDIVFDVDTAASLYGSVVRGPVEDVPTDVDEQLKNLIKEMGDRLVQ
jgi:flagellar assembly protein FliH